MAGQNRNSGDPLPQQQQPQRYLLPSQETLDDLCSRFVLNAPVEELESFERILFLMEQAHWFYEDNTIEQDASLKSLTLREFMSLMFNSCKNLRPYSGHLDNIYKDFTSYKTSVPVTGAIILDESYERCLMVKGWKAGASWSFPRGKKNKDEEDHKCAVREVWEETGFDVSNLLKVEDHLEVFVGQQRMRLYIIVGVNNATNFVPQTKKEISEIGWHRISDLPSNENDTPHNRGTTGLKYYMVRPFIGPLRIWIVSHCPPPETGIRGVTVWKANTGPTPTSQGVSLTKSSQLPPPSDLSSRIDPIQLDFNNSPGKSFRNFTFDLTEILKCLDGT